MKPNIVARGFENAQLLRDYVSHRLGFALGRTGRDLLAVSVRLEDVNGPRGGSDKRCSIELAIPGRPSVFVRALHRSIHAAIDIAAHRAEQALARATARGRRLARESRKSFDAIAAPVAA